MARGRRGGRGRNGGSQEEGALSAFADTLKDITTSMQSLDKSLGSAVGNVADFGKKILEGSAEVVRAKAAFEELSSKTTLSSLEGIGGTVGSLAGGARRALGGVAAAGSAAQELEDIAVQSALRGMPLTKGFEEQLFPLLEARAKSAEAARRQASDVSGGAVRKEAFDAAGGFAERAGRALQGVPGAEQLFGFGERLGDLLYDIIEKKLRERGSR